MKENKLSLLNNNGVVQIGESYIAESGFRYNTGYRQFGSLKIVEEVARGNAITFLRGVKVFDKDGTLIIDKVMGEKFHFERELVRRLVLKELLNMLVEANKENNNFDVVEAKTKISKELKQAYFESSYRAINNWALELGLFDVKTEIS
jgi:hypothetical protein